jgi:spore germination protein YaaH
MARVEYYKQKSTSKGRILWGLLFASILIISSILFLLYPFASPKSEKYFQGENAIVFNGKQEGNAIIEGDVVYIPFEFMKEFIDKNMIFDEKSNSMIITTKNRVIQMPSESLTFYINEKPVKLHFSPLKDEKGKLYIALDPILDYYPIQYHIFPESEGVWIQKDGEAITHGLVTDKDIHKEKLRLRTDTSLWSSYTAQTKQGEPVFIEGEKEDYYFVRKQDGTAGYMNKKFVKKGQTEKVVVKQEQEEFHLPRIDSTIQLTWEAVYHRNPDTAKIPKMPGVNVVSPTWFKLADGKGSINNLGSLEYTNWAKNNGLQVWGLFSNAFDPELTHQAFVDFETRQKMIRALLHYSKMYKLDGINIDIENVNPEDGIFITQFIREATPYFHQAGLVVSMDITFISNGNWSAFYERDKLANLVDYLIVMAYDEHWGSSPVAGSVASLPWVEENLQELLELVPNEKLILGVPLYARLWQVTDSGEVSSKALSMEKVKEWLTENKVKPVYDESSGQNYGEFYAEKEQTTYKIWLEDELSLKKRADLAKKYELAGIGSWSRYFADERAWTALNLNEKQVTQK